MGKTRRILCLLLAVLFLTVSLAACGRETDSVSDSDYSAEENDVFAETGYGAQETPVSAGDELPRWSEPFTPHKFCVNDTIVSGIRLCMTPGMVRRILGEPIEEETDSWDSLQYGYGEYITMEYDGLTLEFIDRSLLSDEEGGYCTLADLEAISPDIEFVNGLHVGSTKEEILETFTYEENPAPLYEYYPYILDGEPIGEYIYGNYTNSWIPDLKPTQALQYAYIEPEWKWVAGGKAEPLEDYRMVYVYVDPLKWNDDMSDFVGIRYGMVFDMDGETDRATKIALYYIMIDQYAY